VLGPLDQVGVRGPDRERFEHQFGVRVVRAGARDEVLCVAPDLALLREPQRVFELALRGLPAGQLLRAREVLAGRAEVAGAARPAPRAAARRGRSGAVRARARSARAAGKS
jgi:hypothetical protein